MFYYIILGDPNPNLQLATLTVEWLFIFFAYFVDLYWLPHNSTETCKSFLQYDLPET